MAEKRCTFCKRPPNEVKQLIGGEGGPLICDRCIGSASATLSEGQKKVQKPEDKPLLKPREIKAFLDDHVISQEKAKMDVAVAVYNHYKRRDAIKRGLKLDVEIQKSNILLLGPSGSGKTEIARAITKMLGVPFYVADATKLTMAGYVGEDVESMLQGLLQDAGGDTERAEWGVIFLDEVDKVARKSGRAASGYRDVTGEGVQQALLKMVEGARVSVPRGMGNRMVSGSGQAADMIDTTNVLFVCAGSFAGIEETVKLRVNKDCRVGFGSSSRKEMDGKDVYLAIEEEDILEFGIIPELLGRLPVHTTTLPLTEDDMVRILTEPKNAIIKQFKALFQMDGMDLQFDDAALRAIGRDAQKRPTGARALRSILEKVLRPYSFDYPSEEEVTAVRITEDVILGKGEAVIVREGRKSKQAAMA
jgi:ATP-dependent Clp protease ATP-binding subunit ClpX